MEFEWKTTKLGKYIDSSLGKMLDKNKNKGEYKPYLGNINVRWGSFELNELSRMKFEPHESDRYGIKKGDLIICEGGEPGRCAIWEEDIPEMKIQKALHRVRPLAGLSVEYLYYWFLYAGKNGLLEPYFTGTTIKHLTGKALAELPIKIPPLHYQQQGASILRKLDKKITLNTQINQTLEQMAQALFKSWFVDFDPVIDNALDAGNPIPETLAERAARRQAMWTAGIEKAPARLSAETRRLFPDRFEEDEVLGWVPKGWKAARLSDITTELRRGISPKYVEEGGVQVINQKCIRNHEVNFSLCRRNDSGVKKVDGRLLELGDLLVNSTGTGTLGRVAMIEQLPEPTVVDSHVTIIRTDPTVYPKHVFAQQMIFIEPYVTALGEGSTGQTELSRKMVADIQVVMPTFNCLDQLETKISAFSQVRSQNRNQVEVLTQLRDTLLPKLLSGELQLPEAEAAVETALEVEIA
tara:strand:- start:27263 stop:28663 length:1401 start_codon:yes stop_codon:yes gene_type:complete